MRFGQKVQHICENMVGKTHFIVRWGDEWIFLWKLCRGDGLGGEGASKIYISGVAVSGKTTTNAEIKKKTVKLVIGNITWIRGFLTFSEGMKLEHR